MAAAAYGQTGSFQIARHYLDRIGRLRVAGSSDRAAILAAFLSLREGDAKAADALLDSVGQIPALDDYVTQLRVRSATLMGEETDPSAGGAAVLLR